MSRVVPNPNPGYEPDPCFLMALASVQDPLASSTRACCSNVTSASEAGRAHLRA